MTAVSSLTGSSPAKGMLSTILGLMIATIGIDLQSGQPRYTMGVAEFSGRRRLRRRSWSACSRSPKCSRALEDLCQGTARRR